VTIKDCANCGGTHYGSYSCPMLTDQQIEAARDRKNQENQQTGLATGIDDATLLRALAEDIPDMALTVREQLRSIARRLGDGELIGHLRCKRCGESAEVKITARVLTHNDADSRRASARSAGVQSCTTGARDGS